LTASRARSKTDKGEKRRRGASAGAVTRNPVRAIVLHPVLREDSKATRGQRPAGRHASARNAVLPEAGLQEALGLARAIQLDVCQSGLVPIARPRPATLFGPGKVEELRGIVEAEAVGLVIVDHPLTAVQQRNLERAWSAKVLDRTGLILEIFGARARTKEGRLQVELAHLLYQRSRLVRSWTHLERQRGGFGFLGGPGETQIEADRRVIGDRIDAIRRDLGAVRRTRELHRASRRRTPFPIVALAGYTNAGKSSLFNALTQADVVAEDKLFATLDPTMRRIGLPGGGTAILSDTVGFISELPTALIAAFRATLEEVSEADLILHVRDIATPHSAQQKLDVEAVLAELGVDVEGHDNTIIEVWNKIDLLTHAQRQALRGQAGRSARTPVPVSARDGEGLGDLRTRIGEVLAASHLVRVVNIGSGEGALLHWLYTHAQIRDRQDHEDGSTRLEVRLAAPDLERFEAMRAKTAANNGAGQAA
jgi:GTP-binding protein HflX